MKLATTNAARMFAALPPSAQTIYTAADGHLDAADSFLADADGLSSAQAMSRARNSRRPLGTSWPELPCTEDAEDASGIETLWGKDPAILFELHELSERPSSSTAIWKAEVDDKWTDADTSAMARHLRIGRRRAQQIRSERICQLQIGKQIELFGAGA